MESERLDEIKQMYYDNLKGQINDWDGFFKELDELDEKKLKEHEELRKTIVPEVYGDENYRQKWNDICEKYLALGKELIEKYKIR